MRRRRRFPTYCPEALEPRLNPSTPGPGQVAVFAITQPVVGGHEEIRVTPSGNFFAILSLHIEGPGLAIASQVWGPNGSADVPFSDQVHGWTGNPAAQDDFSWYWGPVPGKYTVTINEVYRDVALTKYTWSRTFDVQAPTVGLFNVWGSAPTFGQYKPGTIGFSQPVQAAGQDVNYVAKITSNPAPATVGFVQLVHSASYTVTGTQGTWTFRPPVGLDALDQPAGQATPYVSDYSVQVPYGRAVATVGGTVLVGDSPKLGAALPGTFANPANVLKSLEYSATFDTYLDYRPDGGIHVQLARAEWSLSGKAVYSGPLAPNAAEQGKPANWSVVASPSRFWLVPGVVDTFLAAWDANFETARPRYTAWTPAGR